MNSDTTVDRARPNEQVSEEEVEGRLSAHRYILSHLLTKLAADPAELTTVLRWLDERANMNDSEEDPGSVIVPGYIEEQSRADEFDAIAREVRRLVDRGDRGL